MPARYVLERADWAAAAALTMTPTANPQADSLTRFTRSLGMARTGNLQGAKAEIAALEQLRAALEKSSDKYWADRTAEQILAATAWVALAEGAKDKAVELIARAADGEDGSIKHVAMENRLYPMRELLADLLLEAGRPREALTQYLNSLKQYPNRYRGLYGAARAAEAAGDQKTAAAYYTKLIDLSKKSDGARPELARARTFLQSR
jgi:tetratricopeptide (TPR) repeat protein